ncbi:MAG: lipid-binding SYLF domain-containing protein [Deltaproteobacteria bacterium]|nr:lipid-binding SYLF domain-containing protein [Deltaproteobacteria bacterium]
MKRIMKLASVLVAANLVLCLPAWADKKDPNVIVDKSRIVIQEIMASHDKGVPLDLLKNCAGIAVVPSLIKGGFVVGGAYGKGIVLAHRGAGWSGPAFLECAMGSLGLQIGLQSVQLIMVVMGQKTMDAFLKSKFKLGGDVAIAAGPVGARASAATEINLKGGIYSYSRTKGLFAGISLEGAGIDMKPDINKAYYQTAVSTADILAGKASVPASGRELIKVLDKYHR